MEDDEALFDVVQTPAFNARLDAIEAFYLEVGARSVVESLLVELHGTVIPNLRRFPRMGRPYGKRAILSVEGQAQLARLGVTRVDALREYLHGDYLILYAVPAPGHTLYLLSIRHHRQLAFGLPGFSPGD